MKTVLITAIGSLSADIVIKSLKKQGFYVLGCDIYPKEWIVDAYSVDVYYQVPLAVNKNEYLEKVQQICLEHKVEYIVPLTDVEIDTLNNYREQFECIGTTICISPAKTIECCRNKFATYQFLQDNVKTVRVIPTFFLGRLVKKVPEQVTFPLICKPINGRSSNGLRLINTAQEFDAFLGISRDVDYIIQPFIQGRIVTVDIIRQYNGRNVFAVPRMELLRTPNGAGTSVRVFHNDVLQAECTEIADTLGVIGVVNFEFIKDSENRFYFLECNPRFSGGIEFSCMIGYDFIWNHMKCFFGDNIDLLPSYKDCFIARKYEETITAIEE